MVIAEVHNFICSHASAVGNPTCHPVTRMWLSLSLLICRQTTLCANLGRMLAEVQHVPCGNCSQCPMKLSKQSSWHSIHVYFQRIKQFS